MQDRLPQEIRLTKISYIASVNNWLPSFITNFYRYFVVLPKDLEDEHIAYPDNAEGLTNILSIQPTNLAVLQT